jgi:hypothetical protein
MIQVQLHREGVVSGFTPKGEGGHVTVEPGFALDCCGHEILIFEKDTCSENRKAQHL